MRFLNRQLGQLDSAGLYWSVRGKTGLYRAVLDSLLGCTRCKRVIRVIEVIRVIQVFQVTRVVK